MTIFVAAKNLYEGKTVEFSNLWTRDGLNLVLLDGKWGVQTLGYKNFQEKEFALVDGFHPDFFGFVCLEEQARSRDIAWYLASFDRGERCEYDDESKGGHDCGEPASWTVIGQNESSTEEHFCGTHAAEILRDAKIYRVIAA